MTAAVPTLPEAPKVVYTDSSCELEVNMYQRIAVLYSPENSPRFQNGTVQFSLTLRGFFENRRTRYSLDPKANMNTWDFNVSAESLYTTSNGWQFNTDIGYNFYRGYTRGYGQPELLWNAGIGKEIGPVTLSVKVADILNQQKSLQRSISANFVEDVYRNVMGRYIMIGVSFNFGKMNATQANKAQRALWEMM